VLMLKRFACYIFVFVLSACQTTSHLVPMKAGEVDRASLTEGEKRLWSMSEDAEVQIRKSGKLFRFESANRSLVRILNDLYPDQQGNMRISIVKHPILNAFAFPNGGIYIHTGIISAAKNEAQIAAVVAHEGAHYILKHSAKSRIKRSNMMSFALMVNLIGIPFIGELIGASSVMGYSQNLEREADMMGAARLLKAGYDIREAEEMFKYMASDAKANETKHPFFFASHPKLQERIKNFHIFAEKNSEFNGDKINEKQFIKDFEGVYVYALHKKLEIGSYSSIINELEEDGELWYRLPSIEEKLVFADAFRLRGKNGDLESSRKLLMKIIGENPLYWKSYFSLGIIEFTENQFDSAKINFAKARSLNINKNSYIDMYLRKIENNEVEQNEI
jgi:beta-barrel assembly-enhancing protease